VGDVFLGRIFMLQWGEEKEFGCDSGNEGGIEMVLSWDLLCENNMALGVLLD